MGHDVQHNWVSFISFSKAVVVVHIWSLQKLINHMWEGTLADVGLAITTTRSSPWLVLPTLGDETINREGLAPQSG